MRVFLRSLLLLVWIIIGFLWLIIFNKFFNDLIFKKTLIVFGKVFIAICGIKASVKNWDNLRDCKNTLIVSNHISWLDIFVIHSLGIPGIFIAKSEIKVWPLLGILISNAKTIFIDRTKRRSVLSVLKKSKNLLKKNHVVVFFPEGTTSDGFKILPFHTSLFSLFLDSPQSKLLPMVIRYTKLGKKTIEPAYIGSMSLLDSIVKVLGSSNLEVHIEALEFVSKREGLSFSNKAKFKRDLAEMVRNKMLEKI